MANRNYPANCQIQKFLEESYNKERDVRLSWYTKGRANKLEAGKSKQYEVFKRKIQHGPNPGEGILAKLPQNVKEARYNKKIIRQDDTLAERAENSKVVLTAEMRPVSPSCKAKLYDGFTKEGKGRYRYLDLRNEKNPEDKYNFPILSSWDYGWRLSDVIKKEDIKKPVNGRTRIVADTFYTRTGIPTLN